MHRSWTAFSVVTLLGVYGRSFLHAFEEQPRVRGPSSGSRSVDPAFKRVLMYLFVGTRGGYNRLMMVRLLKDEPMNANKIGERLKLDYKTVQHHLKVMSENSVVVTNSAGSYGAMYFVSPYLEKNIEVLDEIWARFGNK